MSLTSRPYHQAWRAVTLKRLVSGPAILTSSTAHLLEKCSHHRALVGAFSGRLRLAEDKRVCLSSMRERSSVPFGGGCDTVKLALERCQPWGNLNTSGTGTRCQYSTSASSRLSCLDHRALVPLPP